MASDWVYGINSVAAVIEVEAQRVEELLVQEGTKNVRVAELQAMAQAAKIGIRIVPGRAFLKQFADQNHQGVAARILSHTYSADSELPALIAQAEGQPLVLMLDCITDPHNLGAVLRTADAAGAIAVVIAKDKSAQVTPLVRKIACGAASKIPVVRVTNLVRTLKSLKQLGLWAYGAAGNATASIYSQDMDRPLVLVLGSEGKGIRRLLSETCDVLTSIPMPGNSESLNISVAAGVLMFEIRRQQQT